MKREIVKNGIAETVFSRFENVHEFVEYALGGYGDNAIERVWNNNYSQNEKLSSWYTEAENMTAENVAMAVLDPSPDYRRLCVEVPDVCGISRRCNVRRVRRGLDCGDDIDVERWAARDLACFEDIERVRCGRPSVRVVVDFFATWDRDHDYFVRFSSLVAAVVEMAENSNINISVDVCFNCSIRAKKKENHKIKTVNNIVALKRENEMLDKNLLLYVCGGHAFYRTLALRAMLRVSAHTWTTKIGCCVPVTLDDSISCGSFVVSAGDTDNAGDVLRKFHNFIEGGETAAAC